MTARRYLKPPWMQRKVGNVLAPLFRPAIVARLSVPGRRSGEWRTTPVVVLDHGGERYLVSVFGTTDWALDLRASGRGRLARQQRVEEFGAEEVPVGQRQPILDAYLARFAKMPHVEAAFRSLPDPADHPTFRLASARD
ncbi:nitroreductase/quinone reductase family protein [Phytohabitans sp. ZYX-F-186]|uniref:Nitroreductase/quinone reductase family protein n=1 Tax=Phytohabitans maris TaxID=3071409 RepID=A0ABU0ZD30_9ACTN|nr:nitroreductase/quinone reductase family protein [Phytohabitans sp. ZYX-F-186]MDQ7904960.1 nitroreductase/quinone reductase family protein [Phytohabitans sp. ZYX-F-186]